MNKWELERQKFAECFLRTVRGALPLSLTHSLAKECGLTVYGNTQKYTTIDGVKYPVPDDVILLDNAGSTVNAFYCTKNGSTGTIDLTTGVFTASSFTAGKITRTETIGGESIEVPICEYSFVGERTENLYDVNETAIGSIDELQAITKPIKSKANVIRATMGGGTIEFTPSAKGIAIPCAKGETFIVRIFGTIETARKYYTECDADGKVLMARASYSGYSEKTITTTQNDCAYLLIEWSIDETDNAQVVVVSGSTAPTEYIPYGYDVPVRMGNQGVVDLGSLTWNYNGTRFRTSVQGLKPVPYDVLSTFCPSILASVTQTVYASGDNCIAVDNNQSALLAKCSRYTDAAAFKAAMSGIHLYYQRTTDAVWNPPTLRHLASSRKLGRIYSGGIAKLKDLTWSMNSSPSGNRFYAELSPEAATSKPVWCSRYGLGSWLAGTSLRNNAFISGTGKLNITADGFDDAASFKASFGEDDVVMYQRTTDSAWSAPIFDTASIKDNVRTSVFRIGHKIFDGTENWTLNAGVSGLFQIAIADSAPQNTSPYVGYCSHFEVIKNKTAGAISDGRCTFQGTSGTSGRVSVKCLAYDGDLAGFKDMLARQYTAGHPVEIWYPHETAVTETATEELLVLPENDVTLDAESTVKPSEATVTFNSRSNY